MTQGRMCQMALILLNTCFSCVLSMPFIAILKYAISSLRFTANSISLLNFTQISLSFRSFFDSSMSVVYSPVRLRFSSTRKTHTMINFYAYIWRFSGNMCVQCACECYVCNEVLRTKDLLQISWEIALNETQNRHKHTQNAPNTAKYIHCEEKQRPKNRLRMHDAGTKDTSEK